jgi:hypothetical protein
VQKKMVAQPSHDTKEKESGSLAATKKNAHND